MTFKVGDLIVTKTTPDNVYEVTHTDSGGKVRLKVHKVLYRNDWSYYMVGDQLRPWYRPNEKWRLWQKPEKVRKGYAKWIHGVAA